MRRPPEWTQFAKFPATSGTILLAIGISIAYWAKVDVTAVMDSPMIARGELWRLITDILPHANVIHLLFNVVWTWTFGTLIEAEFGHIATLGIFLLFALVSSAAEFAFLRGGIGLSGVGYGLFGMLLVLSKKDRRFTGAVDKNTVALFLGWFVLCVFTTVSGVMPIGNIAHGVGMVIGVSLGWVLTAQRPPRSVRFAGLGALTLAALLLATFFRPWVNFSSDAAKEVAYLGWQALDANDDEDAVRWLKDAATMHPSEPTTWFNLAIAYDHIGKEDDATKAYGRAHQLAPDDAEYTAVYQTRTHRQQ